MRNRLEILERLQLLQRQLNELDKEKDVGYVAEDVALRERIKLLKWVIGEE